jgi:ABC-2 type transport system ATP-binding protein
LTTSDEVRVVHRLTGWAIERGVSLQGLTVARLTLEDVYLRLTGAPSSGDERPVASPPIPGAAR